MTTLMFKKITFYFFLLAFTLIALYKGYVEGATTKSTPYRTSPYSSGASVQLRGVSGESTEGDTLTGTYNSAYGAFEFDVVESGFYTKWYDLLGGTSYERDTTWSDDTGKWITGGDMGNSLKGYNTQRFYSNYSDINTFIRGSSGSTIYTFDNIVPDTLVDTNLVYSSNKIIDFGKQLFIHDNNDRKSDDFDAQMNLVLQDSNITFSNGRFYGMADSSIQVNIQNVTTSQMDINLTGIVSDSLKNWFVYVTAGASADSSNLISGNSESVGGWTTITFTTSWAYPPDHTSTVYITPRGQFSHAFWVVQGTNIRFENLDIKNFAGDGIALTDCKDIVIDNVNLYQPKRTYYLKPYVYLNGRQGISIISQPTTSTYSGDWTEHGKTKPNTIGLSKNIRVTNSTILGGSPGCVDVEPNGASLVQDITIAHNYLYNGDRGVVFANALASFRDCLVTDNHFYNCGYSTEVNATDVQNMRICDNTFRNSKQRVGYYPNAEQVVFSGNHIRGNGSTQSIVTNAIQLANNKVIIIENNIFDAWGERQIYADNVDLLIIRNNVFKNIGLSEIAAIEALTIVNCSRVIVENNVFSSDSSQYYLKPGTFNNCDTVIVTNNTSIGASNTNEFTFTNCSNIRYENQNLLDINDLKTSELINLVPYSSLTDSLYIPVDSLNFYIVRFDTTQNITFTIKQPDSILIVHGPDSTTVDSIFQVRNDSLWIVGSSPFDETDIAIYDYNYGTDLRVGEIANVGGTVVGINNYPASRNRITFPGYRNSTPRVFGASIEAWNMATYLTSNPTVNQRTKLKIFTNWVESVGLLYNVDEMRETVSFEGDHVVPTGLVAPSDSTSIPRANEWYVDPSDSTMHVYINGGWVTFNHD